MKTTYPRMKTWWSDDRQEVRLHITFIASTSVKASRRSVKVAMKDAQARLIRAFIKSAKPIRGTACPLFYRTSFAEFAEEKDIYSYGGQLAEWPSYPFPRDEVSWEKL